MYNPRYNNNNEYFYGNIKNNVQNCQRPRNNSVMALNLANNMGHPFYNPYNQFNYGVNNVENMINANRNINRSRSFLQKNEIHNSNYEFDNRYINDDRQKNISNQYMPISQSQSQSQCKTKIKTKSKSRTDVEQMDESNFFCDDDGNLNKSIYMSSNNGSNVYHKTNKRDELKPKRKNEINYRNERIQSVVYDTEDTESMESNDGLSNDSIADNDDILINGNNTYVNIYINGDMSGNKECDDKEEDDEEEEEEDYEQNCEMYNDTGKIRKPKKVFMGKYFLSDLKKTFLKPFHICGPHPTLFAPNPNIFCYGISPKDRERRKKPEIYVSY